MTISDWLDYIYLCRHDCEDCKFTKACGIPYHCNYQTVDRLLETEDIDLFVEELKAMPLGMELWTLSCNGQGRRKGSKDESDGIQ